jgi:DNA topoisomerase II
MESPDTDLSKKYYQVDIKEHAKKKTMWGGSFENSEHWEYLIDDIDTTHVPKFTNAMIVYPDSLYKIYDEIIVNVIDICVERRKTGVHKVTKCIIDFDPTDGRISIFNNGQGFDIGKVPDLNGNMVYIPHLVSTEFLAGSNNSDNEERITGGVNGIGLTMVNNNSSYFKLETVDIIRKLHYVQECRERLTIVGEPIVTELASFKKNYPKDRHRSGGTTIEFIPDWSIYKIDITDSSRYASLNRLFKSRAYQMAAHAGLEVIYNGLFLNIYSLKDLAPMLIESGVFVYTKLDHPKYPWDLVVGLSSDGSVFESYSIINGVYVRTGNHINYIRDLVTEHVKPSVEKIVKKYQSYKKSMVHNNLFILISGNIPNPNFDSQTKTNLSGSAAKYSDYSITTATLNKIWKMLEPRIIEKFLNVGEKKKVRRESTIGIPKYKKAKYAETSKSAQCTLFICEGDSASQTVRTCLTSVVIPKTFDYHGIFILGGVPMNSKRLSTVSVDANGKKQVLRQKKLIDNERLTSLSKVLNLDITRSYATMAERETLSYGGIVAIVDQDIDGIGQIFGLLLSHIENFWPELIKAGYIKRLATPIIRAYPRSTKQWVESFYTEEQYLKWKVATFGPDAEPSGWDIKYYKGLATHNDTESLELFKNYDRSVYTIYYDDEAKNMFDIYFGNNPILRKKELSTRNLDYQLEEDEKQLKISCTAQLRSHTKEFQLDNIIRKLPHLYDGLNPSRRKILCGSRKKLLTNNTEIKVSQLGGYVGEHMNYHHGSASMEKTIVNMAQDFIGANNLPLLLPLSQFGSRFQGGNDAGASRYIKTKLNRELVTLLFREEDDPILTYTVDEGEVGEPIHYMPIAPLVLLESLEIPSTGWKYSGFARNWDDVYGVIKKLIKRYISENKLLPIGPKEIKKMSETALPFWKRGWNGEVRNTPKGDWFVGKYIYADKTNTITIIELPYQEWNDPYVEKISAYDSVQKVDDQSTKTDIKIVIKLKTGALEGEIMKKGDEWFDPIEDYFGLKKKINKHLNVISDNVVIEYDDYINILIDWFKGRHDYYVRRIDRLKVLVELRIEFLKEVIRFVSQSNQYKFSELNEEESIELLKKDNFKLFNKSLLDNPGLTPTSKLEELIMADCKSVVDTKSKNYNYLFNLNSKHKMQEARTAREIKLKELVDYRATLESNTVVADTWLAELADLNTAIGKAMASPKGWLYSERQSKFK